MTEQSTSRWGRSFKVERRRKQLLKVSGARKVKVLATLKGTHEEIFNLEQKIHCAFNLFNLDCKSETWSKEVFKLGTVDSALAWLDINSKTPNFYQEGV